MSSSYSNDLKPMLHPYAFVLKEGKEIKEDLLDYSLVMIHINCREVIKKPLEGKPVLADASLLSIGHAPISDLSKSDNSRPDFS